MIISKTKIDGLKIVKQVKFKDIHTSQKTEREPSERHLKKRDAAEYDINKV
mgnify:CR=1 FL=1